MKALRVLCGLLMVLLIYRTVMAEPVQLNVVRDGTEPYNAGRYDGNWYDFVPFVGTWEEASEHASSQIWQGMQGHLATLAVAEENAFVSQLPALLECAADAQCRQRNILGFWLGGYQASDAFEPSGDWHWITWEIWDIFESQWRPGEPNDFGTGEDRLSLTLDGQWNDLNAQQVLEGYIIEYDFHGRVQWRVEDGGNGHWYVLIHPTEDPISWQEARDLARMSTWQGLSGHLATVTSQEESEFIRRTFLRSERLSVCSFSYSTMHCWYFTRFIGFWLGGRLDTDGNLSWITEEPADFMLPYWPPPSEDIFPLAEWSPLSTVYFGENWYPHGPEDLSSGGYIIEYDSIGDYCASYDMEGLLRVPCVEVSDASGGIHTYQIELQRFPFSFPSWLFVLDLKSISPISVGGTSCANYEADGLLRIPCVEFHGLSGVPHAYQMELHRKAPSWAFDLDPNSMVLLAP